MTVLENNGVECLGVKELVGKDNAVALGFDGVAYANGACRFKGSGALGHQCGIWLGPDLDPVKVGGRFARSREHRGTGFQQYRSKNIGKARCRVKVGVACFADASAFMGVVAILRVIEGDFHEVGK